MPSLGRLLFSIVWGGAAAALIALGVYHATGSLLVEALIAIPMGFVNSLLVGMAVQRA